MHDFYVKLKAIKLNNSWDDEKAREWWLDSDVVKKKTQLYNDLLRRVNKN